jgi:AraC-like DNA-binding protein
MTNSAVLARLDRGQLQNAVEANESRVDASTHWKTTLFPKSERYRAWQEKLQRVYGFSTDDQPIDASFDAELAYRTSGGFQIVSCTCDPFTGKRTRADVQRDDRPSFTIQLVLSGLVHVSVEKATFSLTPGDVLVWSSIKAMRFEVIERLRTVSITMPLTRLQNWLPSSWHSVEGSLSHGSPGNLLLSSLLTSLSSAFLGGAVQDGEALTESLLGALVSVLNAEGVSEPNSLRNFKLASVKRYLHAHLANPNLTPATIADAEQISIRYLHALFEHEGLTVQQYIIRERLLRCRREFENGVMALRTITDIAFSWGFQSSTHFSRRFKAEFGVSPREFRAEAANKSSFLRIKHA